MLYTTEEKNIMSNAIQPNMRNPKILIEPFNNIVADYFNETSFRRKNILDIGPGQCNFLDLAKEAGANHTYGLDFDPAVGALGQLRGHEMTIADLRNGWPYKDVMFDGIFCRGSLDCCWYETEERLIKFLEGLISSLSLTGWLWIAPWNNPAPENEAFIDVVHKLCGDWAARNNITISEIPEQDRARYGIGYIIPKIVIWHRK